MLLPGIGGLAGFVISDVTVTDDGDSAQDSGEGTATHTHNSVTSTGPVSVLLGTWKSPDFRTLNSATWGGNALTILEQRPVAPGGAFIAIINGAQSGNIVLTFSGTAVRSILTVVSLVNLQSLTPVDTDEASSGVGFARLDDLLSPGAHGIRLAAYFNDDSGTAVSWSGATELSDTASDAHRHSAAFDLGDDAGVIEASGNAADDEVIVGVALR